MNSKDSALYAKFLASIPKAATQRAMDRRRRFEGRAQRHSAIRAAIADLKETGFSVQEALLSPGYFFGVQVAKRLGIY
jgi:hypothetical protein